jgi:uncharacterized protein
LRIFLDANILFSAARADGAIRRLLSELRQREHVLVAGPLVIVEARRNLENKANPAALAWLDSMLLSIETSATVPRLVASDIDWLVEKDRHVLRAAMQMQCDVLVTGDVTHFGAGYGRSFDGVKILSPRMTAELLLLLAPSP